MKVLLSQGNPKARRISENGFPELAVQMVHVHVISILDISQYGSNMYVSIDIIIRRL